LVFEAPLALPPEDLESLPKFFPGVDFLTGAPPELAAYLTAVLDWNKAARAPRARGYNAELLRTRETIERTWKPLAESIAREPAQTAVLTSDKNTATFKAVRLDEFAPEASQSLRQAEDYGLTVRTPRENLRIAFERGDSGSILAFQGRVPLLPLHVVDGEETSGGASVVALPSRRPSRAAAEGAPSTANRDSADRGGDAGDPSCATN
jgi:hypothetical protein